MTDKSIGKVWLVGAGPGDSELLTLKAFKLLKKADVILYDNLVGDSVISEIDPSKEVIFVGKKAGNHLVPQEEINQILLEKALEGKNVVRLKGGDPFVFGRGGEELELLAENNIPFEIVPGITSAVAVPEYNGIPVTHRDYASSFHVIAAHLKDGSDNQLDYDTLVRLKGTLVFLMGVGSMEKICNGLIDAGMDANTPAAVLENGTTAHQRKVVSTVSKIYEESQKVEIKPPAILIVGEVCKLSSKYSWYEKLPLAGKKIAITRMRDKNSRLADKLAQRGAEVIYMPSIKINPLEKVKTIENALSISGKYQWIAFTSPTGVDVFFDRMKSIGFDIRRFSGIKFAAVGLVTASAIEKRGIFVDIVPETYNGAEMAKQLVKRVRKGERVLIARGYNGNEEITEILLDHCVKFDDIPIYETISVAKDNVKKYDETIDYVAFTSGSTVRYFAESNPDVDFTKVNALCIGPTTAAEAKNYNMNVTMASEASLDGMIDALM